MKSTIVQVAGSAEWAGGERQLLDLLGALGDRFRFEVICPEEGPLLERLGEQHIPSRVVSLTPLVNPVALARLARALSESRPALVHSHGARSNFYARLACRKAGLRHLSTVHNALDDYPLPAWRRSLYKTLDRLSSRWTERVVCVSESLRGDLLKQGLPAGKIVVIRNGVDTRLFDPGRASPAKLRSEWGPDRLLAGVIGRMTEQKGHAFFLEALARVVRENPRVRGIVVGDGPLRSSLEDRAKTLGLDVLFAGVRQDMPDVLAALDLVVLPSVSEGLPYVLLEALAMGRPVVASAVDGVNEVVTEDGRGAFLVPPRDAAALARAMTSVLNRADRGLEMARKGREIVLRDFSLAAMAQRWADLYSQLAGAG